MEQPRQQFTNSADDHRKDRRATVTAFIAVDRGDDRVLQLHGFHGLRHAFGFAPIHQSGLAVFDVAEGAGACAYVTEHQEGGGAASPALAEVRAHCFFADSMQLFRAHQHL